MLSRKDSPVNKWSDKHFLFNLRDHVSWRQSIGTGFDCPRDKEGIVCYEVLGRVRLFLSRIFQIS